MIQKPKEGTLAGWPIYLMTVPKVQSGERLHGIYHVHPDKNAGTLGFSGSDISTLAKQCVIKTPQLRAFSSYLIAGKRIYVLKVTDMSRARLFAEKIEATAAEKALLNLDKRYTAKFPLTGGAR